MPLSLLFVLAGLGISIALSSIGSSIGVGAVAKVGAGLLSKEPQKFPQVLALAALPSTQALYGLLFGFILLIRTEMLGSNPIAISNEVGMALMLSAIPVAVSCLISGIAQGQVAASGIKILAEKPENLSQAIILAVLLESFAVFGLVISLLLVYVGIKI